MISSYFREIKYNMNVLSQKAKSDQSDPGGHISENPAPYKKAGPGPTVPFHSIRQSRVTGPRITLKCNGCHGDFGQVPKPFENSKKKP